MDKDLHRVIADLALQFEKGLAFTMLEVGAVPVEGQSEPFHAFLDLYPGSRVVAFEVDEAECGKLNARARPGLRFHPVALGRTDGEAPFHLTRSPMCASLYRPREKLLDLYNNLEVARLVSTTRMRTSTLDRFADEAGLPPVDFVKIDVQGAEHDVFAGGARALRDAVAIVSEVEFVRLYEDQPLFGDVCALLEKQGLMFHKFLGFGARALRPVVLQDNPNIGTQHLWSDAVFIRDVTAIDKVSPPSLLKMAALAALYDSIDVTVFCMSAYDRQRGTDVMPRFASHFG